MKILHIKIDRHANDDVRHNIKSEVDEAIKKGVLVTDKSLSVEVLEFDNAELND